MQFPRQKSLSKSSAHFSFCLILLGSVILPISAEICAEYILQMCKDNLKKSTLQLCYVWSANRKMCICHNIFLTNFFIVPEKIVSPFCFQIFMPVVIASKQHSKITGRNMDYVLYTVWSTISFQLSAQENLLVSNPIFCSVSLDICCKI